jgi:hypothetical protein
MNDLRRKRAFYAPSSDDMSKEDKHRVRTRDRHTRRRAGIKPQPCELCGTEPAECHHIDYNDPERRMWLCKACHSAWHSQFAKPAPVDWMADIRAAMKRIDAARARLRAARSTGQEGSGPWD